MITTNKLNIVLDIGKTNVKLIFVDSENKAIFSCKKIINYIFNNFITFAVSFIKYYLIFFILMFFFKVK